MGLELRLPDWPAAELDADSAEAGSAGAEESGQWPPLTSVPARFPRPFSDGSVGFAGPSV